MKKRFFIWIVLTGFGMICLAERLEAGQESLYNPQGRRDPFLPLVTLTSRVASGLLGVETIDEIIVEGVAYDPKSGSVVVANGAVLKEGEELGNVKVLKVKPDGALFLVNGTEGFKSVYQEDKPAAQAKTKLKTPSKGASKK